MLLNFNTYQPYINQHPQKQVKRLSFSENVNKSVFNPERIENAPIDNFWKVGEKFYRGAQPGIIDVDEKGLMHNAKLKKEIIWLRDEKGIRTILNLRNGEDHSTDHMNMEDSVIKELNSKAPLDKQINYQAIEMHAENGIDAYKHAKPILEAFTNAKNKNAGMYWHCRSGKDRTGVAGALHRIWSEPNAKFDDIIEEMRFFKHNEDWYPNLKSSLAGCLKYMATSGEFDDLKNSGSEAGFLRNYYYKNKERIDWWENQGSWHKGR